MKRLSAATRLLGLALALAVLLLGVRPACAASADKLIRKAAEVLDKMAAQKDVGSMAETVKGAHAVAFVPSLVKAGFILGGEYGEGLILKRVKGKWYGPSFYNLGGGSLGMQIGAQEISLVLAVTNEKGVQAFLESKTQLGGEVSVAAGPVGRSAGASTDGQMKASIYSYSMTKGLFAGVSLEGSAISVSPKRNEEYWKKKITADEALQIPAADKRIQPLLQALKRLEQKAN